jgi:hypothetical protein
VSCSGESRVQVANLSAPILEVFLKSHLRFLPQLCPDSTTMEASSSSRSLSPAAEPTVPAGELETVRTLLAEVRDGVKGVKEGVASWRER